MLRITAIGAGAVDYLLRGCDDPAHDHHELEARADSAELGADRYFARAMEAGEPAGMWLGSGWKAFGLGIEAGGRAAEDDVRAIFGQLRRPDSTEQDPVFIGRRPHTFGSYEERLEKLQAAEPDATPERARAMERQARAGGNRAVAYYDFTFSPVKSISVLYAAYLAAGATDLADDVRAAHDDAVKIALAYAEQHVAYTRFGGDRGRVFAEAEGLAVVAFAHHTSREAEPQLHTHAAVLNRVATADGRIGALDGKGFRAFKEAIATAYERAIEQKVTEATGLRFALRPDGKAREIRGMNPDLLAAASTRRGQITARVEVLAAAYRQRHGREPDAAARKVMAQEAAYSTRAAKAGLAGPSAVAAWVDASPGRATQLTDALGRVYDAAEAAPAGATGGVATVTSGELVAAAMAAGLADVQARYATWQLGNLADAIDRHLGDAGTLGVPAEQRANAVEALARRVVDPAEGFGVVQLSGHEPVEVPAVLQRRDGRPVWRPHEERRFATTTHLGTEAGVVTHAAQGGAPQLALDQLDRGPVAALLASAGLSQDQHAAVAGILTSGCRGEVLIGPAGTGKSRTVGTLAAAWREATGGTVYGTATAQVATTNLAAGGLATKNTHRFLAAVTPDPVTGHTEWALQARDLVVIDEASMATTSDLAAITAAAARVGAKVVYVGDPHQLDAVDAGGLFAHLAATLPPAQIHALAQPHRFQQAWEAEASLQLRIGDPAAVEAYADRSRLLAGTVEEMAAAARRGWLADRLDGLDAVLVVGTNDTADVMSGELQAELRALGRVDPEPVAALRDGNRAHVGDVVEARRNAWGLRVDPAPDGTREAVMNRGRYTVLGRTPDGTVLGRDRHGGTAHLPPAYLAEHATLGYAATVHGAEGVTVDASHGLVDRDATREQLYVQATRGARHNYLYLVTEREPDAHEPQRIAEVAAERLTRVLEVSAAQRAAATIAAVDETERTSAPALLARLDHATRAGATPHLATVRDRLGVDLDPADPATERFLAAVRAAELDGNDPALLLERAIASRGFDDVDSVAGALAYRVRGHTLAAHHARTADQHTDDRQPGGEQSERVDDRVPAASNLDEGSPHGSRDAAPEWTRRVRVHGDPVLDGYAQQVIALVEDRQAELGDRAATDSPGWARTLGERPDPDLDPDADHAWRRAAGVTAFYREAAGLDADQISLGAPPSRERPVERALYDAALAAAPHSETVNSETESGRRDWRTTPDAELYTAREQWARELEHAPPWVADELAQTHALARGYREDAALDRARTMALPDSPAREQIGDDADRAAGWAEHHDARLVALEHAHGAGRAWWETSQPQREANTAAGDELERRGLPATRATDEPVTEQREPLGRSISGDPDALAQLRSHDEVARSLQQVRESAARAEASRAARAEQDAAQQAELAQRVETTQSPTRKEAFLQRQRLEDEMLIDDEINARREVNLPPHLQQQLTHRQEQARQREHDDGLEM